MFRFDKEEMQKIAEVADLFKAIKNDGDLAELRAENREFDAFIDAIEDTVSDLYVVMDYYDDYLRDEATKIYVKQYGFNMNEKHEFIF